jgi:hypothetical protein
MVAGRIEIAQGRNDCVSCLWIRSDRAHDPRDRFGVIGIDQNVVLDIQQRPVLQLAGQPTAISEMEIFVQSPGEQRQTVAVAELRCRTKPSIEPATPSNFPAIPSRKKIWLCFVVPELLACVIDKNIERNCGVVKAASNLGSSYERTSLFQS